MLWYCEESVDQNWNKTALNKDFTICHPLEQFFCLSRSYQRNGCVSYDFQLYFDTFRLIFKLKQ